MVVGLKRLGSVLVFLCIIELWCGLSGCSKDNEKYENDKSAARQEEVEKISFKDARGNLICKLKPKEKGYKIYDSEGKTLGKVRVKPDRATLKNPEDVELWKIKRKDYGAEIEDAKGNRLYKIKISDQADGKLEGTDGTAILKFGQKADGYEVKGPDGKIITKVKAREGKVVFEAERGEVLYTLKGATDAQAGMWLAVDRFSLTERAALCVFFLDVL